MTTSEAPKKSNENKIILRLAADVAPAFRWLKPRMRAIRINSLVRTALILENLPNGWCVRRCQDGWIVEVPTEHPNAVLQSECLPELGQALEEAKQQARMFFVDNGIENADEFLNVNDQSAESYVQRLRYGPKGATMIYIDLETPSDDFDTQNEFWAFNHNLIRSAQRIALLNAFQSGSIVEVSLLFWPGDGTEFIGIGKVTQISPKVRIDLIRPFEIAVIPRLRQLPEEAARVGN